MGSTSCNVRLIASEHHTRMMVDKAFQPVRQCSTQWHSRTLMLWVKHACARSTVIMHHRAGLACRGL